MDATKKVLMLAAKTIVGSEHSIQLHTDIPETRDNEIRDTIEPVGGEGSRHHFDTGEVHCK